MRTFFLSLGVLCLVFGLTGLIWGAFGRYLDKHTYSEDDGAAMFYGSVLGAWGIFLMAVSW